MADRAADDAAGAVDGGVDPGVDPGRAAALPRLRPGRPVLRRDAHTLQVGLGAHPVLLPDRPEVAVLLRQLDPTALPTPGEQPDLRDPYVAAALDRLRGAGHLTPSDTPAPASPTPIGVHTLVPGLGDRLAPLLALAGLTHDDRDADLWLVVAGGPVPHEITDPLIHDDVPHLVLGVREGGWRIGPFVVPGVTACCRCVDAHEADEDPRRPLLLAQASRWAREHPETTDPLLELTALTWALRDLRTYLDGGEPSTWSATVELPPPDAPRPTAHTRSWLRHPDCGCAWDLLLDLP